MFYFCSYHGENKLDNSPVCIKDGSHPMEKTREAERPVRVTHIQSGSSQLRLKRFLGNRMRPFGLVSCLNVIGTETWFFFQARVVFNASCTIFISLCFPYIFRKIPFENATLLLICYREKRKMTSFFDIHIDRL